MDALYDTPVPVPRMHSLCEDRAVLGSKFYVMEMVEGRLYTRTALPDVEREERGEIYRDMARHLAHLHAVNPAAVGLGDFGRPGNYFGRQINRWSRQYRASETETIEAMDRLMEWLPENLQPRRHRWCSRRLPAWQRAAASDGAAGGGDPRLGAVNPGRRPCRPRLLVSGVLRQR